MSDANENPNNKTDFQNLGDDFMLNIENYNIEEKEKIVNSPRTLEACKLEGINPEELLYK